MKIIVRVFLLLVAALPLGTGSLRAEAGYGFDIIKEAKKLDVERRQSGAKQMTKEDWAYKVTIENKSFKDIQNLEIKYIVFMQPAHVGGAVKTDMVRNQGEQKLPLFKNFEKYTFVTEPLTRFGVQLQPGYVWRKTGGNQQVKDALGGLWMRLFVNGQQVMEFVDPPTLKTKETWESK